MPSTARQRSGLRGVSALRIALKNLPISMRKEIGLVIAESAIKVQTDMYTFSPKETGITASQIESKISSDKLAARIGFLGLDDGTTRRGFVARFIERGTKGAPDRNIPPQAARPFIAPALDVNETEITANIRGAIRKAIGGTKLGKAFGV